MTVMGNYDTAAFMTYAENVAGQFEKLAEIPRPSGHEEKVSEYLYEWAQSHGFPARRDGFKNVIFDVPATQGFEDRPLAALQAHTDMVFAQRDGLDLDAETHSIRVIIDGGRLFADGTSLGADDGIGAALALCIAKGKAAHGPLRIILTADEESGMSGAENLDADCVRDVRYLINLDSEDEGVATVSSAASSEYVFTRKFTPAKPDGAALSVSVSGLPGGHSGIDIIYGRKNAVKCVSAALNALENAGVAFALASFSGGTAVNAIPSSARAVICVESGKTEEAKSVLSEALAGINARTDEKAEVSVSTANLPESAVSGADTQSAVRFVSELFDGVYSMSEAMEGLVECSSNTGGIKTENGAIAVCVMVRSSDDARLSELCEKQEAAAEKYGFSFGRSGRAAAWRYNPESRLLDVTKRAYLSVFGKEITVEAIHAGLECGAFLRYNPSLDIISIGPTVKNPHTVNEFCDLESVGKVGILVEEILKAL